MVPPRVWGDELHDLYGVVSQEVVQYELSGVPERGICVVPEAVEAQDFAVVVQELLQCVTPLVRPKWLHTFLKLDEGPCEIRRINTYYYTCTREIFVLAIKFFKDMYQCSLVGHQYHQQSSSGETIS